MSDLKDGILEFVRSHPGASTSAVRRGVSAKHSRVGEALSALKEAGELRNRGNGSAHAWHPADESSGGFFVPESALPNAAPEVIEGVRVARWLTPGAAANLFDCAPRTLRRWEKKGCPSWGAGSEKLIPLPHAMLWWLEYRAEKERNKNEVSRLDLRLVLARHNLRQVEDGEPLIYELGRHEGS